MADLFSSAAQTLPFMLPPAEGFEASWNERWNGFDVAVPGGNLFYAEHFFSKAWSDRMFAYLQENERQDWRTIDWRDVYGGYPRAISLYEHPLEAGQHELYGKVIPLPRLTAWYGDPGAAYTYSGIKSEPNPWNDGLLHIKGRIEEMVGSAFNCVLLNWYRGRSRQLELAR